MGAYTFAGIVAPVQGSGWSDAGLLAQAPGFRRGVSDPVHIVRLGVRPNWPPRSRVASVYAARAANGGISISALLLISALGTKLAGIAPVFSPVIATQAV